MFVQENWSVRNKSLLISIAIITIIISPSSYHHHHSYSPPALIITTPPPSLLATTYLYCIPCVVFLSTNMSNFRFTSFIICKNTLASSRKLRINLVKSSSVHELSATGNTTESAYVQAKLTFIYKTFFPVKIISFPVKIISVKIISQ